MILDVKSTKVYVISPGHGKYRDRVCTVFSRLIDEGFKDIEYVKSLPGCDGTSSLTNTVVSIFKKELYNDQPFIIIEDDCTVFHSIDSIHVPDNLDVLYLGVSSNSYPYTMDSLYLMLRPPLVEPTEGCVRSHDDHLTRIVGITGTHAILYQSRKWMKQFMDIIQDITIKTGIIPHDLLFAILQQTFMVYALKKPMFYQDSQLGGQEQMTKVTFQGNRYQIA